MSYIQNSSVQELRICIVGAGMAGLSCALALAKEGFQHVEVYEYASNLGFVGAGIQMAPNMARILDRLGVWDEIASHAVVLNHMSIREGATDAELGAVNLDYIETEYGYPHMVGHRATLARGLYDGCLQFNTIQFFFNTNVQDVSFSDHPSFTAAPRQGDPSRRVHADVLLACDGVKSRLRGSMLQRIGGSDSLDVEDTGQAAHRIVLTREQMESDPELKKLIDADHVTRWIGEKRHIIAYPVEDKSFYNISTTQPDTNFAAAPSTTYTTKGSKPAMMNVFGDYCPMIKRMLDLVPDGEVCEWKLRVHPPLPTWSYGSTALVGDACHPTLPHLAQGAAQAIEDAAVLGTVLSQLPDTMPGSIDKAFKIYEEIRKDRAETLVALAASSGRAMHLGNGKEKEERDRQFAALRSGKGSVPDKWADADVQRIIHGFNCTREAEMRAHEAFGNS